MILLLNAVVLALHPFIDFYDEQTVTQTVFIDALS